MNRVILLPIILFGLAACGEPEMAGSDPHGNGEEHATGPHGGRMLEDGQFALEVTIEERNQPPEFHVFPTWEGEPVDPAEVDLAVELHRLGGEVDIFAFSPEEDRLVGDGVVTEPHSFDVTVEAGYQGQDYEWAYESYEGRTTIAAEAAREAGVLTEPAGPATLQETVSLTGRVSFAPDAIAQVRGRFAGRVQSVTKTVGDRVTAGEALVIVESNESLQEYTVTAPIDGVVLERLTNAGDVAGDAPLLVIGDPSRLVVDLHVFPNDAPKIRKGQTVRISHADGGQTAESRISSFLPRVEAATQTLLARVPLPNKDGTWVPGMYVDGSVVVGEFEVPLAVRTSGIQRFRDFEVVFAQVGETYEVRMLDIGRRTPEWVEVLGGLEPGQPYVTENSFLIKADILKSGASHSH